MTRATVSRMAEFFRVPRTAPILRLLLEPHEVEALGSERRTRDERRRKSSEFDAVLVRCAAAAVTRDGRALGVVPTVEVFNG